jgi:DNA-binding NtrC family response regulator
MARILLVEDEADVRLVMEHVLIDAGYEVDAAATMSNGCELLRFGAYDLVVADGRLPDGTGMDVADLARERGVKALIVTGYAFMLPAVVRDRYNILPKPLHQAELVDAVQRALGHRGLDTP